MRVRAPPGPAGPSLLSTPTRSGGDRRERLAAWGHTAVKRLRHRGLAIDGCDVDDGGILFVPDGRLTLTLDTRAVEVALVLALPDLPGVLGLLRDAQRATALVMALQALPEQFAIGASSDAARAPASLATIDELHALIERAAREGSAVWLGWTVPRSVASAHAATLDGQLQDALVALAQVLRHFAQPADAQPVPPRAGRRHAGVRGDEEAERNKPRTRARPHDRDREPDAEPEAPLEAAGEADASASRVVRSVEARPRLRASLRRRPAPPGAGIDKGARVRVLEGPFAGKEGIVQALDGNGGARVMLGLLAVRIDVKDLASAAESRGRPRLSSSHRRPVPVRS